MDYFVENRFLDKTVMVTGAGSGIGAATASRFHREGANVVVCDVSVAAAREVGMRLGPDRTLVLDADVSSPAQMQAAVAATIDKFKAIDVLVANAGIVFNAGILSMTGEQWRQMLAVDLDGVLYSIQAALPSLIAAKGSIISIASVSGMGGDAGLSAYNAAKGGVINLTRSLALELGPLGVRVNAVCPTLTESRLSAHVQANEDWLARFHERIPLRRHALAEEIAGPIAFLASRDASFINGAILPVDGGLTASSGQP